MPESAIRFTVRNQSGQRAATWKCWSPSGKEDVYVTCRDIHGALKVSLHETGRWHVAYFEGFFEESVLEDSTGQVQVDSSTLGIVLSQSRRGSRSHSESSRRGRQSQSTIHRG